MTLLPSHRVGIFSLIVLPVELVARYWKHLTGSWRRVYVVSAVVLLYLNVFVLVVRLFLRVPALRAAAPTQKEPPFLVSQLIVVALFIALGWAAVRGARAGAVERR